MAKNLGVEFTSSVASGGVAHILDTATSYASGKLLSIRENGTETVYINHDGGIVQAASAVSFIGPAAASGNRTHSNATTALIVNQEGADDIILALKSSDVGTGLTSASNMLTTETDDYLVVGKRAATIGGAVVIANAQDGAQAVVLDFWSQGGTANTNKTTAARALVEFNATEHDGANALANITADGNVFGVRARVGGSQVTRLLVDEDGDLYSVTAAQTFDDEDDVGLLRAFQRATAPSETIRTEFDSFVRYNEDDLVRMGILGAPVDEGGMWNLTQHTRLLTGATWQLHTNMERLRQAFCHLLDNPEDRDGALRLLEA